ncbi:MAG: YeeE/YedE family protein [Methanothrix sp.]|nr:YeeE/YedE family protein [Methanothrix sp.]
MDNQEPKAWSPYVAGALAGLLIVCSVFLTGKYFGASTTFVRFAGMIEGIFSSDRVANSQYFVEHPLEIDWQWMFVVGIFFGSLISSTTSGSFRLQAVPNTWQERFGTLWTKRALAAFAGGLIAMFGARLADG